ncbi:hypothetical protein NBRC13296_03635 [Paenibacillus chitinolyticus]|uniref:hypothetical protein n=1 Tax=Paenibacillus chitinolyticus TaxID=79263 RepID=UPI0035562F22
MEGKPRTRPCGQPPYVKPSYVKPHDARQLRIGRLDAACFAFLYCAKLSARGARRHLTVVNRMLPGSRRAKGARTAAGDLRLRAKPGTLEASATRSRVQ